MTVRINIECDSPLEFARAIGGLIQVARIGYQQETSGKDLIEQIEKAFVQKRNPVGEGVLHDR